MSKFPPAYPLSLQRQQVMASARFSESVQPDDSASAVGSWSVIQGDLQGPAQSAPAEVPMQYPEPKAPPPGFRDPPATGAAGATVPQQSAVPAQGWQASAPASAQASSSSAWTHEAAQPAPAAAPATSAAKVLLGTAQEQAQRLARQKARAKRRGQRAIRWGQMSGLNAQNFALPGFIRQIGSAQNEQSVLVVDNRDKRIQSPFQGWLLDEILLNAQSGISVTSDRQLIRSPNKGYHFNLFYMRTLDGFKFTLVGTMTSYATVEGGLLVHLELRGYRSDQDMTVQMNYVNDAMIMDLKDTLFIPSVVVTVFQGWRVIATSCEVGGRLYACSEGGKVVALDFPLCHFEVRMTATSSADSIGMDANRLEFRFRSAADKIDVSCSQIVVPSTWLVVSRVSGPTLIKNAHWCRDHHARIEGPDQTLQLSQLAAVHAHWTASVEAASIEETGPRVGAVAVESHPDNLDLTCESPLFRCPMAIVPTDALALQCHDRAAEQETVVLPPLSGGPAVVPAAQASSQLRALSGPTAPALVVAPHAQSEVSMTEPGQAPEGVTMAGGSIQVPRRSMEARQSELMAEATVTPQAFVDSVHRVLGSDRGVAPAPAGRPVSYGPPPIVEEVTDC
eukprot:s1306_g29.t1